MGQMKAVVYDEYCSPDGLELRAVERPVIGDDAVLVRVMAASVNPVDWHRLTGTPSIARLEAGLRSPKRHIPGSDLAGRVEAIGSAVAGFKPGDEVFGTAEGSLAEYVAVTEDRIAHKPVNLSIEQAAVVPVAGLTALQGLRDCARLEAGQRVLINGASGGVGTFAVQIAKAFGAEVTGVCSGGNVEMVRAIGADDVVDYTATDFEEREQHYDVLFDTVGNRRLSTCRRTLKPKGVYVMVGGPRTNRWLGPVARVVAGRLLFALTSEKFSTFVAKDDEDDLRFLRDLLESGSVVPVIDRRYDLSDTQQAFQYWERGRTSGKILVTV